MEVSLEKFRKEWNWMWCVNVVWEASVATVTPLWRSASPTHFTHTQTVCEAPALTLTPSRLQEGALWTLMSVWEWGKIKINSVICSLTWDAHMDTHTSTHTEISQHDGAWRVLSYWFCSLFVTLPLGTLWTVFLTSHVAGYVRPHTHTSLINRLSRYLLGLALEAGVVHPGLYNYTTFSFLINC